jgi:hypothetical protein
MRRAIAVSAAGALLAFLGFVVQAAQETPVFRGEVQSIEVGALVTDRTGAFVRGLTRDDFEILEDDRVQDITVFGFVDLPGPASRDASGTRLPSDVTSNDRDGRTYVMVLDPPGRQIGIIRPAEYATLAR